MFFLLAGIPMAIFVLRLLMKLMMGLSILNTLLGWSDSLTEYYNTRIKGVDVTDGHLDTLAFGVDVQSAVIDMGALDIKRDNTKRMDHQGNEILGPDDKPSGCIKNIDGILAQLKNKNKKKKEVIAEKGVGYLIDESAQTIIFVDRRSIPTKAIELSLQRNDLQGEKKNKWNALVGKIYSLGDQDKLSSEDIDLIDEALTGFSAETYKARDAAVKGNAQAFLARSDMPAAEKEKVKYLFAALKKMEDLQRQAEQKKADAKAEFEKRRNGDYGLADEAQAIVSSFDETIDTYVNKVASLFDGQFSRKADDAEDNDGFYQYVNYLVDVTEFECTKVVEQEIAVQRTDVKAEKNDVRSDLVDKPPENNDKEGWYKKGRLKDLQEYKAELEENKKSIEAQRKALPVAAEKILETEDSSSKSKKGIFKDLFSAAFRKRQGMATREKSLDLNLAQDKKTTKEAIHYTARKSLTQPGLFERIRKFFGFRPTGLATAYNFLTGKKVKDLGDKAVDTQFAREESVLKQEKELIDKIKQAEEKIAVVEQLQAKVVKREEESRKNSIEIYREISIANDKQNALSGKQAEVSDQLKVIQNDISEAHEIDSKITSNATKLSDSSARIASTWASLSEEQTAVLTNLRASYELHKQDLEGQVSAVENAADAASVVAAVNQLNLKAVKKELQQADAANDTIVPLAVRSAVDSAVTALSKAVESAASVVVDMHTKIATASTAVDEQVKKTVVDAALALIREEATVAIHYRKTLKALIPGAAEMHVAYDANVQLFSYTYLDDNETVIIQSIKITEKSTQAMLLKFLQNPTEEHRTAIFEDAHFVDLKIAYEETLKNTQKEIQSKEAKNREEIERALPGEGLRDSSSENIMQAIANTLPSAGELKTKLKAALEGPRNGNGADRLKELNAALTVLEAQKTAIAQIKTDLDNATKDLATVNIDGVRVNVQVLRSNQIAQLQQQLRLAAIQVGSALNQLKQDLSEAQGESQGNQFFTEKDEAALHKAIRDAKQYAGKVQIMAAFSALKGTPVYDQLNVELSQTDWSKLDDNAANRIIDRIAGFINEGLYKLESEKDSLESNLTNILSEISVALNPQNQHQVDAAKVQGLIDKAVELSSAIQMLSLSINKVTQLAKKRKEKAMEMLIQVKQRVNEAKEREVVTENSTREQAVTRVQDFVERAIRAAKSAEENAKLLTVEATQAVARAAVERAEAAVIDAKECVPTEGFEHAKSIDAKVVSKAEAAATTAEKASETVIAQVVIEADKQVAELRRVRTAVESNFNSIQSSIIVVTTIQQDFARQDKEDEAKAMQFRVMRAIKASDECAGVLAAAKQNLEAAEISLSSLKSEKIAICKLRKDIDIISSNAASNTASYMSSVTEKKKEVDEIKQDSMRAAEHLHVETRAADLQKRKLNYVDAQEANLVSPLVPAEQQIAVEMRKKSNKAVVLSSSMLQKMKDSSAQLKGFAETVERAYLEGNFTAVKQLYESACIADKDNKKQYKLIMAAIAMEQACYMLLAKAQIFEIVHKQLRGELALDEAKKAISEQEKKIENIADIVAALSMLKKEAQNASFKAMLNDEEPALLVKVDGARLYGPEFSGLLSDLQNLQADVLAYKNALEPSSLVMPNTAAIMDKTAVQAAENALYRTTVLYDLLESIVLCSKAESDKEKGVLMGILSTLKGDSSDKGYSASAQRIEIPNVDGALIRALLAFRETFQREQHNGIFSELVNFIDQAIMENEGSGNEFKPDLKFISILLLKIQILKKEYPDNKLIEHWNKNAKSTLAMFFHDAHIKEIADMQKQIQEFKSKLPDNAKGHLVEIEVLFYKLNRLSAGEITNEDIGLNSQGNNIEIKLLAAIQWKMATLNTILIVQQSKDRHSARISVLTKYKEGLDATVMESVKVELSGLISKAQESLRAIAEGEVELDKVSDAMSSISAVLDMAEQRQQEAKKDAVTAEEHAGQRLAGTRTTIPMRELSPKPQQDSEDLDELSEMFDMSNSRGGLSSCHSIIIT